MKPINKGLSGKSIVRSYLKGENTVELGERLGCSSSNIRWHLLNNGVKLRRRGPRAKQ